MTPASCHLTPGPCSLIHFPSPLGEGSARCAQADPPRQNAAFLRPKTAKGFLDFTSLSALFCAHESGQVAGVQRRRALLAALVGYSPHLLSFMVGRHVKHAVNDLELIACTIAPLLLEDDDVVLPCILRHVLTVVTL